MSSSRSLFLKFVFLFVLFIVIWSIWFGVNHRPEKPGFKQQQFDTTPTDGRQQFDTTPTDGHSNFDCESSECLFNPFGSACGRYTFENRTMWMPERDPNRLSVTQCKEQWDGQELRTLNKRIAEVQWPNASCESAHVQRRQFRVVELLGIGFVGALSFPREQLSEALRPGSNLMIQWGSSAPEQILAGQDHCKDVSEVLAARCFFLPESKCVAAAGKLEQVKKRLWYFADYVNRYDPYSIPPPWKHMGLVWWHAHLFSYIWRLQPHHSKMVETARQQLGLGSRQLGPVHPTIGLHVRHGDACNSPGKPCFPLSGYVGYLLLLQQRYNCSRVFLATDDADVVFQTQFYPQFEWLVYHDPNMEAQKRNDSDKYSLLRVPNLLHNEKAAYKHNIEAKLDQWWRSGHNNRNRVVIDSVIVDLSLLGHCQYLVGSFSSAVFRAALQLATANNHFMPPYISVDRAYCGHFNRKLPVFDATAYSDFRLFFC